MFGFTWEIRVLVSKSFVQRETVVTTEYKIMYKTLEKVCTKIHEIKKAHICSGILFWNNHTWQGGRYTNKQKDICRPEPYW